MKSLSAIYVYITLHTVMRYKKPEHNSPIIIYNSFKLRNKYDILDWAVKRPLVQHYNKEYT